MQSLTLPRREPTVLLALHSVFVCVCPMISLLVTCRIQGICWHSPLQGYGHDASGKLSSHLRSSAPPFVASKLLPMLINLYLWSSSLSLSFSVNWKSKLSEDSIEKSRSGPRKLYENLPKKLRLCFTLLCPTC